MGLAVPVLERGRRVQTVAFYDGASRRAEVKLSELGGEFPFMVILPQNDFEGVLEERLLKAGVTVNWNHRFDDVQNAGETVVVNVEGLGATATGYIVPHWEGVVKRSFPVRAQFLVGADGFDSLVRRRLSIENTCVAEPELFAAYEFEPEEKVEDEVRVVLDESTTNVLWPLPGNKYRWTFQMLKSEMPSGFPAKERRGVRFAQKAIDERIRQYVP